MNTPLRQKFIRDMQIRGFSPRTIKSYVWGVEKLARHYMLRPSELSIEQIHGFQQHLIVKEKVSFPYYKVIVCGLRFFYRHTLGREDVVAYIPFAKQPRKLPVILDQEEVRRLFEVIEDIKYKTLLMTLYSAGLRLFEACKLKVEDIDSDRMLIRVEEGKGGKDRLVQLSTVLLTQLRVYYKSQGGTIQTYLFPAKGRDAPLNTNSVQKKMKTYREKARLKKRATPHSLRHAFATHLLESGENLLKIQQAMGHAHLQTTLVYLHCAKNYINRGTSPLDTLYQHAQGFAPRGKEARP